jgi:hypothetical protein
MFFLISLAVCILGGAFFASAAWLFIAAANEKSLSPLLYFPVVLIHTMPVAIVFGTLAAIIATILFKALSLPKWRPVSKIAWIFSGSGAGVVIGGTFPLFLELIGFGSEGPNAVAMSGNVGALAGISCGAILGCVAWRESA